MTDQEFVRAIMEKISAIKEYRDKYREESIIAYYNAHGTYEGIEEYFEK